MEKTNLVIAIFLLLFSMSTVEAQQRWINDDSLMREYEIEVAKIDSGLTVWNQSSGTTLGERVQDLLNKGFFIALEDSATLHEAFVTGFLLFLDISSIHNLQGWLDTSSLKESVFKFFHSDKAKKPKALIIKKADKTYLTVGFICGQTLNSLRLDKYERAEYIFQKYISKIAPKLDVFHRQPAFYGVDILIIYSYADLTEEINTPEITRLEIRIPYRVFKDFLAYEITEQELADGSTCIITNTILDNPHRINLNLSRGH